MPRQILSDSVYDAVLTMLMDQELTPGGVVSIDGLARRLGVSPTPVREALARLEGPGLIRRTALKGYRVAPILAPAEFADLMEARLLIEPVLATWATRRRSDGFVASLAEIMAVQHDAERGPDFEGFQQFLVADEDFHQAIADQAGQRFLRAAYDALGGHVQRFRLFAGQGVIDAEQAIAEHQVIFEAIRDGSVDLAETAMRTHLLRVAARAQSELEGLSRGLTPTSPS